MTNETTKLNYPLIVVESPHQMPGKAWIAFSEDDICNCFYESQTNWTYDEFESLEEWVDMWGDDKDDWPCGTAAQLETVAFPVVAIDRFGDMELQPQSQAESILDFSLEYISHDLSGLRLLESKEEAEKLLAIDLDYKQHLHNIPRQKIRERVNELMTSGDWA